MPRLARLLLLLVPAGRIEGASVVTLPLPPPSEVTEPIEIPVGEKASLELDFPYPVADWVGTGFTPDPSKFKGKFSIEATRGQPRLYLTALEPGNLALLHLSLTGPSGTILSYPLEVMAAPERLAWTQVSFSPTAPPAPRQPLSFELPKEASTPEKELALLDLTRLLGDLPPAIAEKAARAKGIWCANPATGAEEFGAYSISLLRLVQDRSTADLAFEARILNRTPERLWIDPYSWALRNGDRLYHARTVDFTGTLEPHGSATVTGVIAASPSEVPPYVDLDAWTLLSARLAGSASPRPVQTFELPSFPRR